MRHRRPLTLWFLALAALLFLVLLPDALPAQTGTLVGTAVDAEDGTPLEGATIVADRGEGGTNQRGAIAKRDGSWRIDRLTPGTYRVTITYLGYATFTSEGVEIGPDETTTLNVELTPEAIASESVVVSASRKPEKITEAPASISVVTSQEIEEQPALSSVDHVRGMKGLDIVQSGLAQNTVVTRGFNNIFSGTLTTLTDNRFASIPSLRYNAYYFIPLVNDDIERIEVVRGPGSALYGPNAMNGVLHMITRSPFASQGTRFSLAAGERDVVQVEGRHSGVVGERIGYKISAQYMRGEDWGFVDTAEQGARRIAIEDTLAINPAADTSGILIGKRDSLMERFGAEARVDWQVSDDATLVLSTGFTQAVSNTDVTGVGAAQARNWDYWYHQARFRWHELFVQAFLNRSDAGESYLLRTGQPVIDRSTLFAAQAQHSSAIGEIERLTYGADFILTTPVTDSTITGGNEENDSFNEIGIYLQSETELIEDHLELILAGRLDRHSRLEDPVVSPRAAVVWRADDLGSFRATYNRAYSAPTTNEMFLDLTVQRSDLFNVRANGVPEQGYSFRFDNAGRPMMRSFLAEDQNAYLALDDFSAIWDGVRQAVKQNITDPSLQALVDQIPAPPAGAVGTELRILNPTSGAFDSFAGKTVSGRTAVDPTINNTIEIGWQGIFFDRLGLSVDLYRSQYENFIGPLEVITPTVFFDRTSLTSYVRGTLLSTGMDTAQATLIAGAVASQLAGVPGSKSSIGLPLGNVTAAEATDPTAIMLTYRNYGDITLYGYDVGLQLGLIDGMILGANASYVDKNFFPNLDSVSDLSLNAPKFKYNVELDWRSASLGIHANALWRHVDGFPVRSGVYVGDVRGYSTLSLTAGYALPWVEGLEITVTAQNLLTFVEDDEGGPDEAGPFELRHQEFVGTPAIGRLVLARATYAF